MLSSEKMQWFAMRATYRRGMQIKALLDKEGINNFIPMRYEVRIRNGRKRRELVPVISDLIFVHSVQSELQKFKKNYKAVPDLVRLYLDKASEMLSDIRMSNEDKENKIILGSMITEEAFNKVKDMPIGLCVFSPPYANCFDYCEVYKLEFWIGGFVKSYDDFERFRSIALRSHVNSKFSHEFSNSNKDVDTIASLISSFNIWNKNIPDMIRGYFDDMESMIKNLSKILVNKAKCYIVVANSGYKGILVPTDLLLAEIAEKYGYKVCNIYHARKIRSSSQQMHILNTNYNNLMRESVIELQIIK